MESKSDAGFRQGIRYSARQPGYGIIVVLGGAGAPGKCGAIFFEGFLGLGQERLKAGLLARGRQIRDRKARHLSSPPILVDASSCARKIV